METSLDDLPEHILTHILTFLPTLDAVRTYVLSRQWRNQKLWRSLSSLNFDYNSNIYQGLDPLDACTHFTNFIEQTLKFRSDCPIQKLRVHFNHLIDDELYGWIESRLGGWICYAVSHQATKLDIMLPGSTKYDFYLFLLTGSCVQDLSFSSGQLRHSFPSLNLESIRSVYLYDIALTDDKIMELILCCQNLETLTLQSCSGMERVRICSSRLKNLSLADSYGSSLEICCPNLCYLCILDICMNTYCIKSSTSLEAAVSLSRRIEEDPTDDLKCWVKVLRALICVKKLTAENYVLEVLCKNAAALDGFVFENLSHLELETGWGNCDLLGLAAFLKICPNVTTLTLNFSSLLNEHINYLVPKKLVDNPIEFNIPNLKILILKNSKDAKIEELLRLMNKHGSALEKIVL